jgi:hypothetical protein
MSRSKGIFALVAVLVIFLLVQGCTIGKIIPATKRDNAALSITIDTSFKCQFRVTEVFFIKLTDKEDKLTKDILYKSNYQVPLVYNFLLDIEPGFYAAVGAKGKGSYTEGTGRNKERIEYDVFIYFPEQMVKETITEVKPNTMVYMGLLELACNNSYTMQNNDKLQDFYYLSELFDKEYPYLHPYRIAPTMESFQRSTDSEIEFLNRYKLFFISSDWASRIKHRLEMIDK